MAKDYSSIVVSSRARLSRCLQDVPFPSKMDVEVGDKIISKVYNAIAEQDDFKVYKIKDIPRDDAFVLQEKHLISYDLIENVECGGVCINSSETISVMINEEDHIREQCLLSGLNLETAYRMLEKVDNQICKKLEFFRKI